MKDAIIEVENLSKRYRLGSIGATTLGEALSAGWENLLGRKAPGARLAGPISTRAASREFWALRDVSFTVQPGEVLGIIGRNGAGKSTLLKILSRITEPTSGRARLRGRLASLLEVGTGFHPDFSGRENIFLNGAILGMNKIEIRQKFDEIVAFAELEQFIDTPVKRYSSGMYVRLAFAIAAHLEPEILIVDEVLAVGDAQFQQKCLGKMDDVALQGRTILFVSHVENSIRRLCSRVILLRSGTVAFAGSPAEAFRLHHEAATPASSSSARRPDPADIIRITTAGLTVDGIARDDLLAGAEPELVFQVEASAEISASFEIVLRETNFAPVMFAPIGLASGFKHRFLPGTHQVSFRLKLPTLAEGRYAIDLMLVESGVRTFDHLEDAVTFHVLPAHNGLTGWRFQQATGQGCILLDTSPPFITSVSAKNAPSRDAKPAQDLSRPPSLRVG